MPSIITFLVQGIGFGVAAGTIPGSLHTFIVLETLRYGWRHSIWLIITPLISDTPIIFAAVVTLLAVGEVSDTFLSIIRLIGGAFLFYLAWRVWGQLRAGGFQVETDDTENATAGSTRRALGQAVGLNFFNPNPWIFWSTAMGPILVDAWRASPWHVVAYLGGFYGTFLPLMALVVALFHQTRRFGPRIINGAMWIGLVILAFFALSLWWSVFFPAMP